jgi:Cu/Ag efflux pump CusA
LIDAFVLLALSRPLTIVIALIAVALASLMAVKRMPVDIFPQVGDPAIYVAQPYGGHGSGPDGRLPHLITTSITSSTSPESITSKAKAFKARR